MRYTKVKVRSVDHGNKIDPSVREYMQRWVDFAGLRLVQDAKIKRVTQDADGNYYADVEIVPSKPCEMIELTWTFDFTAFDASGGKFGE